MYVNTLHDKALRDEVTDVASKEWGENDPHPKVFANFRKDTGQQILSLLSGLLELFDVDDLRDNDITWDLGAEPQHMLFLYLIQLQAIFVSSHIKDTDLATVMSVASAPFLESNFGDPLCAAALVKPMFIPYYVQQGGKKPRKGGAEQQDPDPKLKCYRLFTGYELDNTGSNVSSGMDMTLSWTEHSVLQRMQSCKLVEKETKKLWFVTPQMGDRVRMSRESGLKMMGGQTGEKPLKICSYLMSDSIMAYMQCAVFGTISNMLPCHANSDFTQDVMTTIKGSMSTFSDVVRHPSINLMSKLQAMRDTDNCLSIIGVGFNGQDMGQTLNFGRVFTGPDDKRPPPVQGRLGVFTSVALGIGSNTTTKTMLNIALKQDSLSDLRGILSTGHSPAGAKKMVTDSFFYGRYHHMFNNGEVTEVACVKSMSDPGYNTLVHEETLSNNSKYQLTASHGALPMCTLTLAMTIRQAVMMTMGFFCGELARVVYSPKATDVTLCKHLISLAMAAKFRHGRDEESGNVFDACYGKSLKLTGPAFCNPGRNGVNYHDLDSMEWLQADDNNLPGYIQNSMFMIGDTKKQVRRIMHEKNLSYNRVLLLNDVNAMSFKSVFANQEYLIHAPMMTMTNMRVFTNTNNNSYGSVKLSRRGCYYPVKIFSNGCVDTDMYSSQWGNNISCLKGKADATIEEIVERIKKGVSCVLPRINVNHIKMMAPELNESEFGLLVSAVKKSNIEVIGQKGPSMDPFLPAGLTKRKRDEEGGCFSGGAPDESPVSSPEVNGRVSPCLFLKRAAKEGPGGGSPAQSPVSPPEGNGRVSPCLFLKRAAKEGPGGGSPEKKAKVDTGLTIYDTASYGFSDSDSETDFNPFLRVLKK